MKLRITLQGNTYEVDVEVLDGDSRLAAPVVTALAPPPAPVAAPPPAAAPAGSGEKVCKAPIPGNIIGVSVKAGQQVNAGQTVLVLEAMKMETPITSPVAGTVKAVNVQVGSSVKQGQVLVEFE
jgi:biotin carboxyl carrier protein